jgi:hypothetical protein
MFFNGIILKNFGKTRFFHLKQIKKNELLPRFFILKRRRG